MKIKLDNFYLEEFNKDNLEHLEVIRQLNKDQNSKKYLGDIFYAIKKIDLRKENYIDKFNHAFIAYYNSYPVGYISLSYIEEDYQISCGILNQYRKQHLASLLISEFSDYLLNSNYDINKIIAVIDKENTASKMAANLAGYSEDDNTYNIKK